MGVGVYQSDFDNTGSTIIIDDIDNYQDHEKYVDQFFGQIPDVKINEDDEYEFDGKTYSSKEDVCQAYADLNDIGFMSNPENYYENLSDEFWDKALNSIRNTMEMIGVKYFNTNSTERMRMDDEFMLLSSDDGDIFEIGIRGWEHDYVVGIAAGRYISSMLFDYDEGIGPILESGMTESMLKDKYSSIISDVHNLVVAGIQLHSDLDVRFRTSGYTSSSYNSDEDSSEALTAQIELLKTGINIKINQIKNYSIEHLLGDELRSAIKEIDNTDGYMNLKLAIPMYDSENNVVNLASVDFDGAIIDKSMPAPKGFDKLTGKSYDGMLYIDRDDLNDEHKMWFDTIKSDLFYNQRTTTILVSAKDYVEALEKDLSIELEGNEDHKPVSTFPFRNLSLKI